MPRKYQDTTRVEAYQALCRMVGRRIAQMRKDMDITQERLAVMLNRQVSLLGQIEQGRQGINLMDLMRLSHVTGYSLEYFLGLEEPVMVAPATLRDWTRLFPDRPDVAQAHFKLHEIVMSAERSQVAAVS